MPSESNWVLSRNSFLIAVTASFESNFHDSPGEGEVGVFTSQGLPSAS
ncbi:hypothetical protein IQ226_00930 [Dolichospermum sp. LEGE 00240]|nr:hypothetical protein [Dolichospermum sp. LEGE 00240]MBE9247789.1 hypothetical protein [Dolichospermum sp. LEGE 00240]